MSPEVIAQLQELLGPRFETAWAAAVRQAHIQFYGNLVFVGITILLLIAASMLIRKYVYDYKHGGASDSLEVGAVCTGLLAFMCVFIAVWALADAIGFLLNPTYRYIHLLMGR